VPQARYAVNCCDPIRQDNRHVVRRRVPSSVVTTGDSWNNLDSCLGRMYQPAVSRYREPSGVVWERRVTGVYGAIACVRGLAPR
jgi:hypothetical protein